MTLKKCCWPRATSKDNEAPAGSKNRAPAGKKIEAPAAKSKKEPIRINKWTLRIKDPIIRKEFQKYAMGNVMRKMPVLIAFQTLFLLANLSGFSSERFLNLERVIQSAFLAIIMIVPFFLTKATGQGVYMKCMPFIYGIFQITMTNYMLFYAFSEEG